jgi:hypothetical protein
MRRWKGDGKEPRRLSLVQVGDRQPLLRHGFLCRPLLRATTRSWKESKKDAGPAATCRERRNHGPCLTGVLFRRETPCQPGLWQGWVQPRPSPEGTARASGEPMVKPRVRTPISVIIGAQIIEGVVKEPRQSTRLRRFRSTTRIKIRRKIDAGPTIPSRVLASPSQEGQPLIHPRGDFPSQHSMGVSPQGFHTPSQLEWGWFSRRKVE